ncbi:AbrB/MazE/SpoVT family DNA-binding domain-containing protein [Candidatus Woesearchaeota archaeon]|nr:AbrB/MazE/SpoVT family DNA-binding domain-containing protein [Candidatus Woesearchaeota archaeon]
MIQIQTKVGARGQIVIPKLIRESLGINEDQTIFLEVDKKVLKITSAPERDLVKAWEEIAKKEGGNVTKSFVYGDKLYEGEF